MDVSYLPLVVQVNWFLLICFPISTILPANANFVEISPIFPVGTSGNGIQPGFQIFKPTLQLTNVPLTQTSGATTTNPLNSFYIQSESNQLIGGAPINLPYSSETAISGFGSSQNSASFRPVPQTADFLYNNRNSLASLQANTNGIVGANLPSSGSLFLKSPVISSSAPSYAQPSYSIILPNYLQKFSQNVVPYPGLGSISTPNTAATSFLQNDGKVTLQNSEQGIASVQFNKVASPLPSASTVQDQVTQIPCTLTLRVPNPLPITLNPSTGIPYIPPAVGIQSSVPSSFVDTSPPTIAILRPPSDILPTSGSMTISDAASPVISTQISESSSGKSQLIDDRVKLTTSAGLVTTMRENTKQKEIPHQDSMGNPDQNYEAHLRPNYEIDENSTGFARNNLPFVYGMLPPSNLHASEVYPPVEVSNTKSINSASNARPSQRKNPFFNVNKRKHFEFYQYF